MFHTEQSFEVRSGVLQVADPLYLAERVRCALYDLRARNGTWRVEVVTGEYGEWGPRISELRCRHGSISDNESIEDLISDDIGVDAATVCVYETADGIENAHESEEPLVVGPHGACSTSGIGDGTYTACGRYDGEELVAVRVVFIPGAAGRTPETGA